MQKLTMRELIADLEERRQAALARQMFYTAHQFQLSIEALRRKLDADEG